MYFIDLVIGVAVLFLSLWELVEGIKEKRLKQILISIGIGIVGILLLYLYYTVK